jgi:methylenetetrahydrofolate--tRNA-(uracil-5-)-methyltransferase
MWMDFSMTPVGVIGAGLAGCEASWQLQRQGIAVTLYEMKPQQYSPAHSMPGMAELVCSNSLRGADLGNAVGLLKEELRRSGSLIMEAADATSVPAGGALAVDRQAFSDYVTDRINRSPLITVVQQECTHIPNHPLIIVATGPLTSPAFADTLAAYVGERLYFYDAVAPIVLSDSLDHQVVYAASRYGKGDGDDYLNCPLDEEQYRRFIEALKSAELVTPHHFEKVDFWQVKNVVASCFSEKLQQNMLLTFGSKFYNYDEKKEIAFFAGQVYKISKENLVRRNVDFSEKTLLEIKQKADGKKRNKIR